MLVQKKHRCFPVCLVIGSSSNLHASRFTFTTRTDGQPDSLWFSNCCGFHRWNLQRGLGESKAWEEEKARAKASGIKQHPYRTLFSNHTSVKWLMFLIGVYMFWNLVAGAMGFFMPYVYETAGGISNKSADILQAVLWILTALATYYGFAKFGDKVNHRIFFFTGAAMAAASWVVLTFVGMQQSWSLWAFVILWGLSAGIGAQAWYALWATELFPTQFRAGSQGVMFFVVRASAGIWSIIFPTVLNSLGFTVAGICMIGLLLVSLVIGTIWTPQTKDKSLEEITLEQYGPDFVEGETANSAHHDNQRLDSEPNGNVVLPKTGSTK